MPHEQMIRSAERLITFHLSQIDDPAWPQVTLKLGLLDSAARKPAPRGARHAGARTRLRRHQDARRDPLPVDDGGAHRRRRRRRPGRRQPRGQRRLHARGLGKIRAWARSATPPTASCKAPTGCSKTAAKDDLTLEGSPEQIQKALVDMYKADYAKEWGKFVQGVTVTRPERLRRQRAGDEPAGRSADLAASRAC